MYVYPHVLLSLNVLHFKLCNVNGMRDFYLRYYLTVGWKQKVLDDR